MHVGVPITGLLDVELIFARAVKWPYEVLTYCLPSNIRNGLLLYICLIRSSEK